MIIGLTGGIGSGKSAAAVILEKEFGYLVLQTDHIARELMNQDEALKTRLKQAFGPGIYSEEGLLDKKVYAELIYNDPEKRALSDSIVHPAVWEEVCRLVQKNPSRNIVIETALPGSRLREICDRVFCVQSDPEIRIKRLMNNRNYTRIFAQTLLKNQKSDSWYKERSDDVIANNQGLDELKKELRRVLCS